MWTKWFVPLWSKNKGMWSLIGHLYVLVIEMQRFSPLSICKWSAGPGPRKTDEQLVPQQAAKNLRALCCPRVRCGILVLVLSYPTASRIQFFLEEGTLLLNHNVLRYMQNLWTPKKPYISSWSRKKLQTLLARAWASQYDSLPFVLKNNFLKQSVPGFNFLWDWGISTQIKL